MEDRQTGAGAPIHDDDSNDIEIVEVVGLDEDSPAAAAVVEDIENDDAVEIVFDDHDGAAAGPGPDNEELEQLRERHARLQAEFDNFRKRSAREQSERKRQAAAGLVERLLPVLDNFERALAAVQPADGDAGLVEGVEMIQRQLTEELRKAGLATIESVGRTFDPEVHEAVATTRDDGVEREIILEEIQRGYFFHERLLRPALVCVNVPDSDDQTQATDGDEVGEDS